MPSLNFYSTRKSSQGVLHILQAFHTLLIVQSVIVKPEIVPSFPVFELFSQTPFQNFNDCFADDESDSLGESIYPYCFAEWVCDRSEVRSGTFCPWAENVAAS